MQQPTPPLSDSLAETQADSLEALSDSLRALADTTRGDTTTLDRLNREIRETGELVVRGDWDVVGERLWDEVIEFIPALIGAFFVVLLFWALYRIGHGILHGIIRRSTRLNQGIGQLLLKSFSVFMWVVATVMVLGQLGIDVTALVAGLGIAGIALGFAARDTLENFIAGITILLDQPFRIGDNIQVDDSFGTVEEMTLRSTRIRTLNNELAVLPNTHLITNKLINHTKLDTIRVEVPFGIAYKEFPQQAREVVLTQTEGDDRLHPDYTPSVVVTAMNESSVDMMLRLYLRDPKLEIPVRFDYLEKIREALRAADIEIPFPHRQLFIDEAKAFEQSPLLRPPTGGPPSA